MQRITHWTARRAGGRITLNGRDSVSRDLVKVVGVDTITATEDGVIAKDRNNVSYVLGTPA